MPNHWARFVATLRSRQVTQLTSSLAGTRVGTARVAKLALLAIANRSLSRRMTSGQWTQNRWATWQNSQTRQWTPQKVRRQRDHRADVEARAATILTDVTHILPVIPPASSTAGVHHSLTARSAEKKAAAEKIKLCLALRKTVTSSASLASIDAELAVARAIANSGKASPTQIKEAADAVAEAEIRHEKAAAHLTTAKEHERRAKSDLAQAQLELTRLKASVSTPSPAEPLVEDLQVMAATLDSLSTSATFTPTGQAIVDPKILQRLVTQLQKAAAVPSSVRNAPTEVFESAAEMEIGANSAAEPLALDDPYTSAAGGATDGPADQDSFSGLEAEDLRSRLRRLSSQARPGTSLKKLPGNQHGSARIVPLRRMVGKVGVATRWKDENPKPKKPRSAAAALNFNLSPHASREVMSDV